jgi:hypothetical protein
MDRAIDGFWSHSNLPKADIGANGHTLYNLLFLVRIASRSWGRHGADSSAFLDIADLALAPNMISSASLMHAARFHSYQDHRLRYYCQPRLLSRKPYAA